MAGNRQQFTLQFNADTAQAKRAIQDLNNSLKKVSEASINDFGISRELEEASNAAKELRTHIAAATNASTGKLNLNEFNASIKMSEHSLNSLLSKLANGGAAGQAAFMSFANAVAQSEIPLKKVNATLANMATTLKNTIKWELSSSFVHGLEGALQGAVSYAKNLNTSLTNIRIVTGQSADDMARFAIQANKAAKELSTTTKAYADASLIYYQQGDTQEQAAKKAAITIKAANASFNTSAAEMSEYLTAVWNSYQVGADELERYVDIMAALGAKTATSLEEIATSMQKVAATANTVGVSMEQVSSIISTVSSVTRESAESIGTSYKTIFARIGDLKLGDALEDGVTLGQVSSELDKIGIKILDANGEMRDMGAIIEDLGSKWQTLGRAQQTAIAQVVAGKRQYTQLMALFENWQMYQNNMNIASGADGSLQEMADIYAESWEAASTRVKTALESIYSSLINDEAIIKVTNFTASVVDGLSGFVKTLGGAGGVLRQFGAIAMIVFQKQISNGITQAIGSIQKFFNTKNQASEYVASLNHIKTTLQTIKTTSDQAGTTTEIDNAIQLIDLKEILAQKEANLDELQKNAAQAAISSMSEEINMVNQLGKTYDQADQQIQELIQSMSTADIRSMDLLQGPSGTGMTSLAADKQALDLILEDYYTTPNITYAQGEAAYDYIQNKLKASTLSGVERAYGSAVEDMAAIDAAIQRIESLKSSANGAESEAKELSLAIDFIGQYAQKAGGSAQTAFEELKTNMNSLPADELRNKFNELKQAIMSETYDVESYEKLRQKLADLKIIVPANASKFDLLEAAAKKAGIQFFQLDTSSKKLEGGFTSLKSKIEGLGTSLNQNLNKLQSVASMMMSFASAITSASNAAQNWDDNDLAGKIGAIGSSLSSVASMGIAGFQVGGVWGAVIGAGLGIIGSVIGAIDGYNKKIEEERLERLSKNAEQTQQQLTNLKQTKSETEALVSSYGKLWGEYEQTGTITEELITATQELASAYGLVDGAVIKTAEDLKSLRSELILSTLHENAEIASEYRTIINTGLIGVTSGKSLREKNDNLTLELGRTEFSEYEMTEMANQGLLTPEQQEFYNRGLTHIDSAMALTGDLFGLSNNYMVTYGQQHTAQPDWNRITSATALIEAIENDEFFGGLESVTEFMAMLEEADIELSDDFVNSYEFYRDANGAVVLKGSSGGYEYFNPYDADAYSGSIYQSNPAQVYGRTYYVSDVGFTEWAPTIDMRTGNFKVSESNKNRSEKLGTYNLGTQFSELLDMFGGVDNATTAKHIGAILLKMFTNSDWTSFFNDYISTKDPETQAAYQDFINKLTVGGFETVSEMFSAASGLGFNDTFTTNWTFDDDGRAKTLTTIANNYYQGLQKSGNELITNMLGEDFSITNFMQTDDTDLFDNNGELIWDDLLPQDLPKQYIAIQEASQAIADKKAAIYEYIRNNALSEDSAEYQALMSVIDQLDAIDTIYQQIIKEDSVAAKTLAPIIEAQQGLEKLGVADKILKSTLSGASPHDTLKTVSDLIDSSDPALLGITAEKGTKEYLEQRQALIESLITIYANDLSGFTTLYLNLEKILFSAAGNTDLMSQYMPILLKKGIDTADKLTNDVIRAIILAASQGIDLEKSELFQGATATIGFDNNITEMTAEQAKFQNAVSKRTSDQSAATDLYNLLFNSDGSARTFLTKELGLDQTFNYNTFKDMAKEDQDAYLELINQKYTDYISGMWEAAIDATPDEKDVENYATLYNRWSTKAADQFKLETGADGSLHVAGYAAVTGHKDGAYTVGADGSLYLNGELVTAPTTAQTGYRDTLLLEQQYQSDVANYNNAVAGASSFALMTPKTKQTSDELTAAEKQIMQMERAQNKIDALTNAISEFQSTGKLSKSTKNALEMLGINADDIDTIDELISQIETLQNTTDLTKWEDVATASGLTTDKLTGENGIFRADGTVKGFDELEDSTITQEQYNNAVRAYEMKLAILGIDTEELKLQYQQAEATKAINEAIELQKQTVEKLKEDAAEMTAAYNALSNSIGKSALSFETIAKATQAGLDVSNWSSDISTQLDIISEAAYKAYEAEVKVLEAQKLNVEGIKNLTRNRTDYAKLINDMLSKDMLDSGELDKFINDYFGQFDGATQEAVRSYISSLEAAGQSFTWEGLIEYLTAENLMTQNEIDLLRANLKDGLTGMLDEAIAEHQAAAQEVADAWVTAFDAIMKAKEGLADGKSIAESLMGDTESQAALLSQYFQNNPNATNEEATAWLRNRNLSQSAPEFTLDSWSLSNWSQARGMFSVANRNKSQEGTNNEFAQDAGAWERWVNDRFLEKWNQMDATAREKAGVKTYDAYVEKAWVDFLNGRSKEEAYWDERAAMVVAEADANQQWYDSQIQTAQTTYQNTVDNAQNQQAAWQQIYDAQAQVLADETGELSLEDVLGDNLYSLLNTINEGRAEEDRYTLDNLTSMTLSDIATQINAQTANISAAEVQLGKDLAAGTDLDGNTVDLSDTAAGEEALEEAATNTASAQDVEVSPDQVQDDLWSSTAASVGMVQQEFEDFAQTLYETAGYTGDITEASDELQQKYRDLAKEVVEIQNAWDDLCNSQKESIKLLKSGNKANPKYASSLKAVTKDIKKIFGNSLKDTEKFVENNIDLIEDMANGIEGAAEDVEEAFLRAQAAQEGWDYDKEIEINFDVDNDGLTDQLTTIGEMLNNFADQHANEPVGFVATVDNTPAIAGLNQVLSAGIMTADQITAALNAIGWEPEVTWKEYTGSFTDAMQAHGYVKTLTGYEPIGEEIEGTYEGKYYLPVIGSATKKGGGASGLGPKSGGGKGGGGGGGSKPKKLDQKKPEDHKERYHETEQTLERLADQLEQVDKLKSRAYGKGHLDAIKQEIGLLKQEIDLQKDYLKQAQKYIGIDRNRVASLGATFNADGTISNYDELIDSIVAKYNAFIDKYNASSASTQELLEEEKEKIDEWFEESMDWITQYEETLNIIRDKENEILELHNEISARALEEIQYKIEFKLELNEAETDFFDYLNEKYSEVLEKQDIMVENLIKQQQLAQENLGYLNNAKTELDAKYASGELSQADYVSGLQDINDQILENLSTLEDLRKEIQEAYGNALEMATEAINNHTEKMEHASSMMQSYISIMGLIGQGVDYKKLSEFYEKQYEYNLNSLKTQQDYLDVLKEEQAYYLAKMAAGELTETERKQFEDLQDTIAEVEEGILSKTEETLTALREAFALTVEGILKGFEESIAGAGNSLEDLATDYEYYLEVQERNVSASKELYEISKLNRQIEQDIADTSSSVYKQRLAALQEEIKAKSADRALTEYDIQMMNLEYELLQRQMALEEAKNAKDTVRLTRDSSGNYIYQYTANQDAVNEAQQRVEDVLQRMAEANQERVTQLEQETINTYQNMVAQIEEIANSEVLTQEEKNARIAEIVARTQEKMTWIQEQYVYATENTASTYELIQSQYGANMASSAEMTKNSMNSTIGEIIAKTNEFASNMQTVQSDVAEQLALLYTNMDTVLSTSKWSEAASSIQNYDLVIEDAEKDAQKMINTLGGDNGLLDNIKTTTSAWDAQSLAVKNLITYYEQLYQSILKIQQTESTKTPTPPFTPSPEPKPEEKPPVTTEPEDEEANANQVQYQGGSWQFYTYDAASGGNRGAVFHGKNKSPVVTKEDESANRIKISGVDGDGHSFSGRWISKVYKNKELWKAYETGGLVDYTGPAWVDGTKERPELMLNATDTQNMLTAVQTVRSLDIATLNMLDDFIKLAASSMLSADALHASGVTKHEQALQQEVHITAEFPNVQNSTEIQDAFDNLINRATQFVGTFKKY